MPVHVSIGQPCCQWSVLQVAAHPPVLPVTLAVVDAAGPDDWLDLVRGSLLLALEALPPSSLFALIGVSDCITLVDMSGEHTLGGVNMVTPCFALILHLVCMNIHVVTCCYFIDAHQM